MTGRPARIAIVAGEASGDLLASQLMQAIRAKLPDATFFGVGGPKMLGAGFQAWQPLETLAVRGLVEVLRHFPRLLALRSDLKRRLLADPPDVFIGVDAPDFNLGLEKALKGRGIPTIHYVSPSIWAWRGGRVHKIGAAASRVLTLFPFEPALYERHGIPVTYVGHPLADLLPLADGRQTARAMFGLSDDEPVFALLPGSRQSEVQYMADAFIGAARLIRQQLPTARFLVPLATRETRVLFDAAVQRCQAQDLPLRQLFGHAHEAMMAADVVLVTSGTATLEAALLKRPMVIAYKISPITYRLVRKRFYLPYFGLPNILAGRFVVPEFIQHDATPENLAQAVLNLRAEKAVCDQLRQRFHAIHVQLRQGAADKAAAAVIDHLPPTLRSNAAAAI
ncbi:MAG: lipid-A-disaccharide synthase [Dokdonella sp.]|nr:MAG: lipid-A-disaccharide synthase [Dokdonella sp.]